MRNDTLWPDSSGAHFSVCSRYRYKLWRAWDDAKPVIAFCMLNPSTADASANDPTIDRCIERAKRGGYGRLLVVNLFALRSTDPRALYAAEDPVGPDNFDAILWAVKGSAMFVCAWGTHGKHCGMGANILRRLHQYYPGRAHALKMNADGSPAHPLYLPYALTPAPIEDGARGEG